jgi:hypothetical protein
MIFSILKLFLVTGFFSFLVTRMRPISASRSTATFFARQDLALPSFVDVRIANRWRQNCGHEKVGIIFQPILTLPKICWLIS